MINEILVRRKNKVAFEEPVYLLYDNKEVRPLVASMLANIKEYGYTLDSDLINELLHIEKGTLIQIYDDLVSILKNLTGADKEYHPLYPNFPQEVMEADAAELFVNAIIHYLSNGTYYPRSAINAQPLLEDMKDLTILYQGSVDDVLSIGKNLLSSKTSLSDQDYLDLKQILNTWGHGNDVIPEEIPLKENVAFLGKYLMELKQGPAYNSLAKFIKTPTDLLRLLVAVSDGDISLASPTIFRKLKRPERRMVMNLLAKMQNSPGFLEDLFRYKNEWIRIGEIVHPGEFRKQIKYKEVIEAFQKLRDNDKPETLRTRIYEAIKKGDCLTAAKLLTQRPGEFARNLDKLIRDSNTHWSLTWSDQKKILDLFETVADQVSTPVLLQAMTHFMDRDKFEYRAVMPKGKTSQINIIENPKEIPYLYSLEVARVIAKVIIRKFTQKEPLGKVYVSDALKGYVVPFSQRSASPGKKQLVRGSRIKIDDDTNIVRAFLWWTNQSNKKIQTAWGGPSLVERRVDLDLSCSVYDEKYSLIETISFRNLWSVRHKGLVHSGDIVNGGDVNGPGVAEFIDIDIETVKKYGGRYVVFQCYSFTGQSYDELPNSSFGWMSRKDMNSGEIFEPSTVENLIDLSQPTTKFTPVIFDLGTREFIWVDTNISTQRTIGWSGSFLEANIDKTTKLLWAMTHLSKPDLYTLVDLNVMARGEFTEDRNAADIIFDVDTTLPVTFDLDKLSYVPNKEVKIITPYDFDYIVSDLL